MQKNNRDVRYDGQLQVEAYHFAGLVQPFPNHFHEHYAVGLVETGERLLTHNNKTHPIGPGDLMLFNPRDNHACEQNGTDALHYRGINIKPEVMQAITREIYGSGQLLYFTQPVVYRTAAASLLRSVHSAIMAGEGGLQKEEGFLLLMEHILSHYAHPGTPEVPTGKRQEMEDVCAYLDEHYAEKVSLETLGTIAGLNKYTLVRTFARWKGITPYRYLETVRVNRAKQLLEQGVEISDVAQQTGFADQSHFTGFFSRFIGLSPKQYQSIFMQKQGGGTLEH